MEEFPNERQEVIKVKAKKQLEEIDNPYNIDFAATYKSRFRAIITLIFNDGVYPDCTIIPVEFRPEWDAFKYQFYTGKYNSQQIELGYDPRDKKDMEEEETQKRAEHQARLYFQDGFKLGEGIPEEYGEGAYTELWAPSKIGRIQIKIEEVKE